MYFFCHVFSFFFGQKWASIHFLVTAREEKHRQTEEQPMTVTTKKQAQHDIGTTRSVPHAFSRSVHPIPNQLLASISSYWCPKPLNTKLPVDGVELVPFLDLGIKVKQERLISTRKSEKQKIQNSVDCAFDYLGLI